MGGQYHLELMFWPWKLGIGLGAATLVTAMTATLARNGGEINGRVWLIGSLLLTLILAAGALSDHSHVNEPADDDDEDDAPAIKSALIHQV